MCFRLSEISFEEILVPWIYWIKNQGWKVRKAHPYISFYIGRLISHASRLGHNLPGDFCGALKRCFYHRRYVAAWKMLCARDRFRGKNTALYFFFRKRFSRGMSLWREKIGLSLFPSPAPSPPRISFLHPSSGLPDRRWNTFCTTKLWWYIFALTSCFLKVHSRLHHLCRRPCKTFSDIFSGWKSIR